jgi:hypothetical protein
MGLLMNSVEFNFLGIAVALSLSLANIRQHFGLEIDLSIGPWNSVHNLSWVTMFCSCYRQFMPLHLPAEVGLLLYQLCSFY